MPSKNTAQTSVVRQSKRKERIGIVHSDKMQKTIVVQIRRKTKHPMVNKVIERAVKYKVHDEKNEAKKGDRVRIIETRPLSRQKRWRLVEILERAGSSINSELKDGFEAISQAKKTASPDKVETVKE